MICQRCGKECDARAEVDASLVVGNYKAVSMCCGADIIVDLTPPENKKPCPDCGGDGYTAEHDPFDPHEGGVCVNCPIEVPCETCQGTGEIDDDNRTD